MFQQQHSCFLKGQSFASQLIQSQKDEMLVLSTCSPEIYTKLPKQTVNYSMVKDVTVDELHDKVR